MPLPSPQTRTLCYSMGRVLCALSAPLVLHAQTSDSLTTAVTRALAAHNLVGAAWSLVMPDRVLVGAAGLRDRERHRPMSPGTRVQVGSITKTLIAVGVLHLVTEGRLALDTPVLHYLPELPVDNPWEHQQPVLVRHLLDHTSGLDDVHLWQIFTMRGHPHAPLSAGLVRPGGRLTIRYRPGARFSYSNTGFLTLALLIERVTGARYERWLDRELLQQLGMTRSTFTFVSQVGAQADTAMAMGYFDGVTPQASYAVPVRPAAQFATTATDMATFARFLMSDGMVQGRVFVDTSLLRAMATPTTTEAVQAGLSSGYALGLTRRERWGLTGKCHSGNLGTFRAMLCVYPEHQRAFFVSYNTDPENVNFDAVDSLFASTLGVPPTAVVAGASPSVTPSDWTGWYVVRPNRFAQFAYLDEMSGVTRIKWDGRVLMLRPFQGAARELHPVGGALFRQRERRAASHVLSRAPDGARIVADGQRTFERVSRWRILALLTSAICGVTGLLYVFCVGSYRCFRAWHSRAVQGEALSWGTVAVFMLALTPLLYIGETALSIGDPTTANLAAAFATGALPVLIAASLVHRWRLGMRTRSAFFDVLALIGGFQWCLILAGWGLLPLMLWR